MNSKKLFHFTNTQNLRKIIGDNLLRKEGHNFEQIIRHIDMGNVSADKVVHPSGQDIRVIWRAMNKQYKLIGRYVWLTEENDARCVTVQRNFEKVAIVFDMKRIGAKRWFDVMAVKSERSKKAKKLIKHLNEIAIKSGDDITKWWVVDKDMPLKYCEGVIVPNKLAA
jgi:hypothetical protein